MPQEPEDPDPYNTPCQQEVAKQTNALPQFLILSPYPHHNFKKWGNDKNCPFFSLSCNWFHPLQNKDHCFFSPTIFLYLPLDLASAAGLIPCRSKPTVPYQPPPLFGVP
jgi:hypothetical protein